MIIHGLNKLTLLDYPGKMACLVFTGGCNFRCPFCQNASLVLNPDSQPVISGQDFFSFLDKRRGVLEGVVISGGEPTLNGDLPEFAEKIREYGLSVKLDTNGTDPEMLERLLTAGLLDYVAMDIKNSAEKYAKTAGISEASALLSKVSRSVDLIMEKAPDYEFRTTVIREFHDVSDLLAIGSRIRGAKAYYLQPFRDCDSLVGAPEGTFHAPEKQLLQEACEQLRSLVQRCAIRGEDQ